MGRLDSVSDVTGRLTPLDLNAVNIENIINELNRNSDQLDAIANSLSIIGRGTLTGTWDGTAGGTVILSAAHGLTLAPIFISTFKRSDQPGVFYPGAHWFYNGAGTLTAEAFTQTDTSNITFEFIGHTAGSPATITFSYYIIQQPAQVPTGA